MAVDVATLKLVVDEATIVSIFTDLSNEISDLEDKKNQYLALRNRIDDVWQTTDGESEKYKEAIDAQLKNIDLTLESVVSAFEQFGKLDDNLKKALSAVKDLADTVADEVKELFV